MRREQVEGEGLGDGAKRTLVIACGALARELLDVIRANNLTHLTVTCLPAHWHNRPERIAPGVKAKIRSARRAGFEEILCLYGECGTGGELDRVLSEEGVERIPGDHCYAFYAGLERFTAMQDQEIGSFYLTDYLARHFDRLIIKGLGLDRFPALLETYFGHYTRVVYLSQTGDTELAGKAAACAAKLGLRLEVVETGFGLIPDFLKGEERHAGQDHRLLA